jgi:hypothetical protein
MEVGNLIGKCIKMQEDVFLMQSGKYVFGGVREVIGRVEAGAAGLFNIIVLKSSGINALPPGLIIQRGAANCVLSQECFDKLPEYILTTSSPGTFKSGGHIEGMQNGKAVRMQSADKGGIGQGASHADGGIKGEVGTDGKPIEFEGNEIILTAPVASDTSTYDFEGQQMTPRQIASKLNTDNGGVAFADGGEIKSCRCRGRMYNYGGETISDYQVVERINRCGCDHEKERYEILSQLNAGTLTLDDAFAKINKTF